MPACFHLSNRLSIVFAVVSWAARVATRDQDCHGSPAVRHDIGDAALVEDQREVSRLRMMRPAFACAPGQIISEAPIKAQGILACGAHCDRLMSARGPGQVQQRPQRTVVMNIFACDGLVLQENDCNLTLKQL
jgi:hypothetical protein